MLSMPTATLAFVTLSGQKATEVGSQVLLPQHGNFNLFIFKIFSPL